MHYSLESAGVWVDCIHERHAVIHNEYASLPHRKGLPSGHAPVQRELAVPIMRRGIITAVLGVGNKSSDYEETDVEIVASLADLAWDFVERKRAEESLHESRNMLRYVLDTIPQSVFWKDRHSVYLGCNQVFANTVGINNPSDIVGKTDFDMPWTSEEIETFRSDDAEVISKKAAKWHIIEHAQQADGSMIYANTTKLPLMDNKGNVYGVLGVYEDITERMRMEEELRESEARYKAISEYSHNAICTVDEKGKILWCNEKMLDISGYSEEQIYGADGFSAFLAPESIEFVMSNFFKFLSGEPYEHHYSFYFIRADGVKRLCEKYMMDVMDKHGKRNLIISMLDITERKQAEENYQTLFCEMLDGFAQHEIVCDQQGKPINYRFLAINPAFERITGLRAKELIGRTVLEALPGTEQHWIDTYGKVALTGEPAFFENYTAKLNKYFEVTAFRPAPNQFACIFADITERKRAEEEREKLQAQLMQAQKMESVGRLAGGVAHDFNNMLGVILGHTELALMQIDPALPLFMDLKEVQKAAQRSADLTRQLLAFARKQTIAPKVVDLNKTVEGMLKMLQRLIGEDIELLWLPQENLYPVRIDPAQIDQILANLFVNARDAIEGVGKVILETGNVVFDEAYSAQKTGFVPGNFVMLAVSDNGCGMDEKTLANIFDPFFTTKGVGEGTGLGLATVYGAVKQNNGFINVYSEPGKGATFKIYLPRFEGENAEEKRTSAAAIPLSQGEMVLLVEDEPNLLRLGKNMLEKLGYRVLVAENPQIAIQLAEEHGNQIHLLITDVIMPGMNGRDLAEKLLSSYPDIKCLFMSGYTANVIANRGVLDEGLHFIQKPFSLSNLALQIREALRGK